jgi:hypothetical protein
VITLCAGLALLGLLAWAFSGGGSKPAAARNGAQAPGARPAAAYSGAANSSSVGAGASPGASASASAGSSASLPFLTASPSPGAGTPGDGTPGAGTPGRGAAASSKATARGAAAANAGNAAAGVEPDGRCAPNAIVLSLFASKRSYHAGQRPVFEVYAVSTAARPCAFDLSPARLHVLVSSSGRVIWDSADCTRGQPDKRAELRRGVPAQTSLSWNRAISLPGCVTVASSARPGTYQVQARDASVASPVRSFRLARS